MIVGVDEGGAGKQAGLRPGLRIVACNSHRVESLGQEGIVEILKGEAAEGRQMMLRTVPWTLHKALADIAALGEEELLGRIL